MAHGGEDIVGLEGEALELVLPNAIEAIQASLPALEQFIAAHDLAPAVANRIEVIFEELVSNAIRHGFSAGSGQSVHVRLAATAANVELTFEDDGAPFNPLDQAAPAPFEAIETARLGGLGLPLVRKMSAAMRYERPAEASRSFKPVNRLLVTVAR